MTESCAATTALRRCSWAASTPDYRAYHDTEWGFPVADDVRLFEKLSLEGFQAGLSWLTILRKREAFRARVRRASTSSGSRASARATSSGCWPTPAIVRHRGKIEAVINNAKRAVELVEAEGSLARYVWGFEPPAAPSALDRAALDRACRVTAESKALAKDLKRRGWRFVGPTTVYAFMQAMGLVNDHLDGCDAGDAVAEQRSVSSGPARPVRELRCCDDVGRHPRTAQRPALCWARRRCGAADDQGRGRTRVSTASWTGSRRDSSRLTAPLGSDPDLRLSGVDLHQRRRTGRPRGSGKRVLEPGKLVSLDVAAEVDGYHADAAVTVPVGAVDEQRRKLVDATRAALAAGMNQLSLG